MDKRTALDRATATVGWMLWIGIYMLGIGAFLVVLEWVSPVENWRPLTWGVGTWLLSISITIIGTIGYTLVMLLLVYGVKIMIAKWGAKLQPATNIKREVNKDAKQSS